MKVQTHLGDTLEAMEALRARYDKNVKAIYEGLTKLGFECVKPEGAFYLFVKSPVEDETVFSAAAVHHPYANATVVW